MCSVILVNSVGGDEPQVYVEINKKNEKSLYLSILRAGDGSGTQKMKDVVKTSITMGCEGRVHLIAEGASYIFFLKMGMVPDDLKRSQNYLEWKYGYSSEVVYKFIDGDGELEDSEWSDLKRIYSKEKNLKAVTQETLKENKDFFRSLTTKEYIEDYFDLLLKRSKEWSSGKRQEKSVVVQTMMHLSEEGLKRWKKSINENTPFESFRKFEHLTPLMTAEQRKAFDTIFSSMSNSSKDDKKS